MKTIHTTIIGDAGDMTSVASESIDLVVTSPPYPMIRMWDDLFCGQNSSIRKHLDASEGMAAFQLMHRELDRVWYEVFRVLKTHGFACINIGDATRKLGDDFCLSGSLFRHRNNPGRGRRCLPQQHRYREGRCTLFGYWKRSETDC